MDCAIHGGEEIELDAILNSDDNTPVTIYPDGTIKPVIVKPSAKTKKAKGVSTVST